MGLWFVEGWQNQANYVKDYLFFKHIDIVARAAKKWRNGLQQGVTSVGVGVHWTLLLRWHICTEYLKSFCSVQDYYLIVVKFDYLLISQHNKVQLKIWNLIKILNYRASGVILQKWNTLNWPLNKLAPSFLLLREGMNACNYTNICIIIYLGELWDAIRKISLDYTSMNLELYWKYLYNSLSCMSFVVFT